MKDKILKLKEFFYKKIMQDFKYLIQEIYQEGKSKMTYEKYLEEKTNIQDEIMIIMLRELSNFESSKLKSFILDEITKIISKTTKLTLEYVNDDK